MNTTSTDRIYSNRRVLVGRNMADAERYMGVKGWKRGEVVIVLTDWFPSTIAGALGGMHIAEAHFTTPSYEGKNYEAALECVQRCLVRSGGRVLPERS